MQPHGGALRRGGKPGNRGGYGTPTNAFREALFGDLETRRAIASSIADGEPTQHAAFPLGAVLQHARCPKCNGALVPNDAASLVLVEIEGKISASPKDRLSAIDWMAKYSIGTVKEVSVDNVRDRVNKTLDVIQARTSAEQYALIVAELQPVWST